MADKNIIDENKSIITGEEVYHIYNRGVAKQNIFREISDYYHFIDTLNYYLDDKVDQKLSLVREEELKKIIGSKPKKPLVKILAYCLMPNHFHLLLESLMENGKSIFIRRAINSYVRYFNTKHNRVGPLFQGRFKSVPIESDEQLIHVSRYIHLNPFVEKIVEDPNDYQWSSCKNYFSGKENRICKNDLILNIVGSSKLYKEFVGDYASYAQDLHQIKHQLLEEN